LNNDSVGELLLFIGIIAFGAILGFFGAHISWYVYGQIQSIMGVFPSALFYPPNIIYQIAWTIFGVIAFFKWAIDRPSRRTIRRKREIGYRRLYCPNCEKDFFHNETYCNECGSRLSLSFIPKNLESK